MDTSQHPCYGVDWDISAKECAGCSVRTRCERLTKMRKSGKMPKPSVKETTISKTIPELESISPLEHLLQSLTGRFKKREKEGKTAFGYFFSEGAKNKVIIMVSKGTGRIRIQAPGYEKVLKKIESIEQAEEILAGVTT